MSDASVRTCPNCGSESVTKSKPRLVMTFGDYAIVVLLTFCTGIFGVGLVQELAKFLTSVFPDGMMSASAGFIPAVLGLPIAIVFGLLGFWLGRLLVVRVRTSSGNAETRCDMRCEHCGHTWSETIPTRVGNRST